MPVPHELAAFATFYGISLAGEFVAKTIRRAEQHSKKISHHPAAHFVRFVIAACCSMPMHHGGEAMKEYAVHLIVYSGYVLRSHE